MGSEVLLSVKTARQRMLEAFSPVQVETVPLEQAWKRVLAEDITAQTDWPPFANSSMDGFAVRSSDVASASGDNPVRLKVIGDIPAGILPTIIVQSGEAARIMTGAPVPEGADAVVPVEDTDLQTNIPEVNLPEHVQISQPARPGAYIRPRGYDLHANQVVLQAQHLLRAQDVALLAMLGITQIPVYRKPIVAMLSTGDELLPPQLPLTPGKIHDANSYSLKALIEECGGEIVLLGISPDRFDTIQERLDFAVSQGVDVILSSAGVSVGTYDFVRAVIESHGYLEFWKVNMRPGKPVAFGRYRNIPVIGLPGNPVSAFISFEVFVRSILYKLAGRPEPEREAIPVVLEEAVESDGRESYLRAVVIYRDGKRLAHLTGHQGSGNLYSLVQANALLIVPSGVKSLPAGSTVDIWPFVN